MTGTPHRTRPLAPAAGGWRARWTARAAATGAFDEGAGDRVFDRVVKTTGLADPARLAQLVAGADRLIREFGISYTIYGGNASADPRRPWVFDPLPLVLSAGEWAPIAAAVAQRARVLDAVLADLLGPQRLIRDGVLPAALVLANPRFLRPTHGIDPVGGVRLFLAAVDLVRKPDGVWHVLADRTQTPSGMGYALADRELSSRLFGDVLGTLGVRPLAPFFDRVRQTLADLAAVDDPTVVVLTPGPFNETFFEHAYLARTFGFRLVRGEDLQVRDGRVWLDTLGGPEAVHVILRRVDDAFADPLELRADSALGVAGLLGAARAGRVVIANVLGAGLVESPALAPFLPAAARALLGEELALDAVEARAVDPRQPMAWPDAVLKSVSGQDPLFADRSGKDRIARLAEDLAIDPFAWTAQRKVVPSIMPTAIGESVEPRSIVLRCFAVSDGRGGWQVMPGGLTRFAIRAGSTVVSMQRGGGAKDTWVLDPEDSAEPGDDRPPAHLILRRRAADLPSRVADNQYWLGRYTERTEHLVRLLRAFALRLAVAGPNAPPPPAVAAVLARFGVHPAVGPVLTAARPSARLLLTAAGGRQPSALPGLIEQVGRIAGQLRDRLAPDAWRVLSRLAVPAAEEGPLDPADLIARLDALIVDLAAWSGIVAENLTRGSAWRFLDIGRRIERSVLTASLVEIAWPVADGAGPAALDLVLEVTDSALTQRWRTRGGLHPISIADVVLLDDSNPRALAFQALVLRDHIAALPGTDGEPETRALRRKAEENHFAFRLGEAEAWAVPARLRVETQAAVDRAHRLSEALYARYLRPLPGVDTP